MTGEGILQLFGRPRANGKGKIVPKIIIVQ